MRTRSVKKEELVKKKAMEMLVKQGLHHFSMNKLAAACRISVATLYIYYRDKDDMISRLGIEAGKKFFMATLEGFSPDMGLRAGLKVQWNNRLRYALSHPLETEFYEALRSTPYGEKIVESSIEDFKKQMTLFFSQVMAKGEMIAITSVEVLWSIAFGPLYTLVRFHMDGKSLGNKLFRISQSAVDEAFELVMNALTPKAKRNETRKDG